MLIAKMLSHRVGFWSCFIVFLIISNKEIQNKNTVMFLMYFRQQQFIALHHLPMDTRSLPFDHHCSCIHHRDSPACILFSLLSLQCQKEGFNSGIKQWNNLNCSQNFQNFQNLQRLPRDGPIYIVLKSKSLASEQSQYLKSCR